MLKPLVLTGLLAAAASTAQAQGVQFGGATLDVNTTNIAVEGFGNFDILSYSGDVAVNIGAFGIQAGVNHVNDTDMTEFAFPFDVSYTGYEVHAFYDVTEFLRAGAIAAWDDYGGNRSDVLGVEAIWTPDIFRVEGRVAGFDEEPTGGWLYNFSAEAEIVEGFNPFVQVRRNVYDGDNGYYFRTEVGLSYNPVETVEVYGSLGRATNDFGGGIVDQETTANFGFRVHLGRPSGPSSLGEADTERLFRYVGFF